MSDEERSLTVAEEPTTDLTETDLQRVDEFVKAGLPGITKIDEPMMARIMDMYLSGRTYRQIATTSRIEKSLVLYLSNRFNWYAMRQDYLADLEQNTRPRVIEAKIVNQDFLLQLQQMWQKKIGGNINEYLATGNIKYANEIDLKEVAMYLKTVEMLQKLDASKKEGSTSPAVGLNVGDGVTITRKGDNEVEITPKQRTIGDALKQLADFRREQEKKDV